MKKNVARRPRFKRVSNLPKLRMTARDRTMLSAVCRYRFITTSQIHKLIPGSRQNISRRLQRLYHAGFLERPQAQLPLRYSRQLSELVYSPTMESFEQSDSSIEQVRPQKGAKSISPLFLLHALSVSRALVQVEIECKKLGLRFLNEQALIHSYPQLKGKKRIEWRVQMRADNATERIGVIPDAVFAIDRKIRLGVLRYFYFLEADRGTMPLKRKSLRGSSIHRKALAYIQTRRSHTLPERFGIPGFQVLFIAKTQKRLEGIKEVCGEAQKRKPTSLFLYADENDCDYLRLFFPDLDSGSS